MNMDNEKREISFEDIRKIRRWTTNRTVYDFPFMNNTPIGIRLLTQDELLRASIFWQKEAQSLELKDQDSYLAASYAFNTMELLRKACYVWETDRQFFKSIDEVWELSRDETTVLFDYYNRVQERYAPAEKLKTEEDFQELIEDIKKKWVGGISLSSYTIERLLHTLIANPKILQSLNGSSSMQWSKLKEKMKKELLKTQEPIIISKDEMR